MIVFHYTYILVALAYCLTGRYLNLIVITNLLIIHEIGHYLVAKIFLFNVKKIIIYPFGGITKIEDLINKNIDEEILIATAGIIFQYIFYLIIIYFNNIGIIRDRVLYIYTLYNTSIIMFNLLPIYPLDGSKIINLILSKYLNFNLANYLTIVISIISLVLCIVFKLFDVNYSYIMVISVLLSYNYRYLREIKYIYNKFLLERVLYKFNYQQLKIINNYKKMFKNRKHLFIINNKYISEDKYLKKYYFK